MRITNLLLTGAIVGLCAGAGVEARQQAATVPANPSPGCTATPAQLEATKKVGIDFFSGLVDRHTLIDPTYKQHNPGLKKQAAEAHITDAEQINQTLTRLFGPEGRGQVQGGGRGPAQGPQPPAGNQLEIVTVSCDLVTVVHKAFRQDPTAAPGTFYEAFSFDTFRVKNGKMVEHWDGAVIAPPAPAGARGQ